MYRNIKVCKSLRSLLIYFAKEIKFYTIVMLLHTLIPKVHCMAHSRLSANDLLYIL